MTTEKGKGLTEMTKTEMMTAYNARSAAHVYALGFVYMSRLYAAKLSFAELSQYFKLDRASSKRGGFLKIRIRLSAADRAELSAKAELIGAEDLLTKDAKHNKGENFERELTERWTAETWVKDSVPFWMAGDIRVDGVEIQIKLDGAELTNEKILSQVA
jgi:hypothetical protein